MDESLSKRVDRLLVDILDYGWFPSFEMSDDEARVTVRATNPDRPNEIVVVHFFVNIETGRVNFERAERVELVHRRFYRNKSEALASLAG
jgi:hypothetical protein